MPVIGPVHTSLLSYFFLLEGNCENLLSEMSDHHKSLFVTGTGQCRVLQHVKSVTFGSNDP